MELIELLRDIDFEGEIKSVQVCDIVYDSRKGAKGTVFVCISGENADGHSFAFSAYENGTRVFVVERFLDLPEDALQVKVKNSRIALSFMSAAFFRYPARELKTVGVTGTKGKSTITYLVRAAFAEAGIECGVIGTNGIEYGTVSKPTVNTTPESYEIHKTLREMVNSGMKAVVMEVSSQGLKMYRTSSILFDAGVFTNISPDHIGPAEHKDMAEYICCKSSLFSQCKNGIINIDDKESDFIIKNAKCKIFTYSQNQEADITACNMELWKSAQALGVKFKAKVKEEELDVTVCQPGRFSVYNALSVIGVCVALEIDKKAAAAALEKTSIRGRAELVPVIPEITVMIDYAHNKLSLQNILETLREYHPKRIVCLFGSVGGRTRLRRPQLGKIASTLADFCILTSDNPDNEDPLAIIQDILKGFRENKCPYVIIPDRKEAIEYAVKNARPGDLLLLTGKGHEDYQLVNGVKEPFSEIEIVKKAAKELKAALTF